LKFYGGKKVGQLTLGGAKGKAGLGNVPWMIWGDGNGWLRMEPGAVIVIVCIMQETELENE
jgi:hypothetical protein